MVVRTLLVASAFGLAPAALAQMADLNAAPDEAHQPHWSTTLAPGEWCGTNQRYLAHLASMGFAAPDAACLANGPCDTPGSRDAAIPTASTPFKIYRLMFHVFRHNDGSNPASTQADVDSAVATLNQNYAPWNIGFIYQTEFINDTRYRVLDAGEEWAMKRTYNESPATQLNVYITETTGGNWGTFPWDSRSLGAQGGIVMNRGAFNATTGVPFVLTHEVGHCLGLWHTHHGVSEVPACSDCYEPAGRPPEIGDVTGDFCADTNPSPRNDGRCSDPPEPDPCTGLPWLDAPMTNFMSYSYVCNVEFTPQQAGRMHCWTTTNLTGWLELPAPPAAPGAPGLTKVGGGTINIAWSDNSATEDGFRVERQTKAGGNNWTNTQTVATLGANATSTTDSPGPGTHRYRVQAFNGLGNSNWSGWTQIKN